MSQIPKHADVFGPPDIKTMGGTHSIPTSQTSQTKAETHSIQAIALYNNADDLFTRNFSSPEEILDAGGYYPVYAQPLTCAPEDAPEKMFTSLNVDERPGGRVFRSLSVGDIVLTVDESFDKRWFLCKTVGWEEVDGAQVRIDPGALSFVGVLSTLGGQALLTHGGI